MDTTKLKIANDLQNAIAECKRDFKIIESDYLILNSTICLMRKYMEQEKINEITENLRNLITDAIVARKEELEKQFAEL